MDNTTVNANPTRAFFVHTITKDISLIDCILDLIDNSIDAACKKERGGPISLGSGADLSEYKIEVVCDETTFRITDNAGGITLDDAIDYAFTFGRSAETDSESYSIGVYGIGMKRAIFKIGNSVSVRSTFTEGKDERQSFRVPIDVHEWLAQDDNKMNWDFDLEEADHLKSPGVLIEIKELAKEVSAEFQNPSFLTALKAALSRDYSLHLHRGVRIKLNKDWIKGWDIRLRESDEFKPMRVSFTDPEESDVLVEVIAGMMSPPPDSTDTDASSAVIERRSGWYVACNGRIVLAGDKGEVSGWGVDKFPRWHPQYVGFIGIVVFTSSDSSLLPLTTTKRSIDGSSQVFRRTQKTMREVSRDWIAYTNSRKQARSQAKRLESSTKAIDIQQVEPREKVSLPKLDETPTTPMASISYKVAKSDARELAIAFGQANMPQRDVGLRSFEYAYSDLVDSET